MKRKIVVVLLLLVSLTGCGRKLNGLLGNETGDHSDIITSVLTKTVNGEGEVVFFPVPQTIVQVEACAVYSNTLCQSLPYKNTNRQVVTYVKKNDVLYIYNLKGAFREANMIRVTYIQ